MTDPREDAGREPSRPQAGRGGPGAGSSAPPVALPGDATDAGALEVREAGEALIVAFGTTLTVPQTVAHWASLPAAVADTGASRVELVLERLQRFDSSGVALVAALRRQCAERGQECDVRGAPESFLDLLATAEREPAEERGGGAHTDSLLVEIGDRTEKVLTGLKQGVAFIGDTALALADSVRHPRRVRWRDLFACLQQSGAEAFPIVALICFLMGVIMAFQAAVQLHDFGADIYVADLVGLSITRELGPLMVAVIVAGRSGAGFAAEIGTMKVGEEIDALVTMGLAPQRFLIVPKVLALVIALPCLTVLGDLIGILGGLLISMTVLRLPALVYWNETCKAVSYSDVFGGLVKSVCFALLVGGIGCYRGLQTGASAHSVGRVTTSAVVTGIFFIILADAAFTIVYHLMGI